MLTRFSHVGLFVTPSTVARQAPLYVGILQTRTVECVDKPSCRGSSQLRDWTHVSRMAGRCGTVWATGKPKNSGVGSLSLLQQIFPIQEMNLGLLHCRWIIYLPGYEGSPNNMARSSKKKEDVVNVNKLILRSNIVQVSPSKSPQFPVRTVIGQVKWEDRGQDCSCLYRLLSKAKLLIHLSPRAALSSFPPPQKRTLQVIFLKKKIRNKKIYHRGVRKR